MVISPWVLEAEGAPNRTVEEAGGALTRLWEMADLVNMIDRGFPKTGRLAASGLVWLSTPLAPFRRALRHAYPRGRVQARRASWLRFPNTSQQCHSPWMRQ